MTRFKAFVPLVAFLVICGCRAEPGTATAGSTTPAAAPAASTNTAAHDINRAAMDTSVAPGDDFFRFANGGWLAKTEIPPDRSSYGTFDVLAEQSQMRTRGLLEAAASSTASAGSEERKIGDFYASFMDEATIEKRGLAPLGPTLDAIKA